MSSWVFPSWFLCSGTSLTWFFIFFITYYLGITEELIHKNLSQTVKEWILNTKPGSHGLYYPGGVHQEKIMCDEMNLIFDKFTSKIKSTLN